MMKTDNTIVNPILNKAKIIFKVKDIEPFLNTNLGHVDAFMSPYSVDS